MKVYSKSYDSRPVDDNRLWEHISLICLMSLLLLILLPAPATAALPPRPGGNQQSISEDGHDGNGRGDVHSEAWARANGAFIQLHVQPAQPDLWTTVEWQNGAGEWLEVEGWQGLLEGSQKVWWVHRDNLGKGPFRWIVYTGQHRAVFLGSAQFYLPAAVGETQAVEIVLSEPAASSTPLAVVPVSPSSTGDLDGTRAPQPTQAITVQLETTLPVTTASTEPRPAPSPTAPVISLRPTSQPTQDEGVELTSTPVATPTPEAQVAANTVEPQGSSSLRAITLNQSVSAVNVEPGQHVNWTLTLHNPTVFTFKGVIVSDILSPELLYLGSETSRGRLEVIGEPPMIIVYVGEVRAGERVEISIYTQVPTNSLPGSAYSNFAMYGSHELLTIASSQVKVLVQAPAQPARPLSAVIFRVINPLQGVGQMTWGLALLILSGYIWSRIRTARRIQSQGVEPAYAVEAARAFEVEAETPASAQDFGALSLIAEGQAAEAAPDPDYLELIQACPQTESPGIALLGDGSEAVSSPPTLFEGRES